MAAQSEPNMARVREEVLAGEGLSLHAAARRLPPARKARGSNRDAPVNAATIWRWVVDGINLPDGRRLRLEACRVSSRWMTSIGALGRFIDSQTPTLSDGQQPAQRTARARETASARAARLLESAGA
jgi:hypothetical protein